MASSSRLTMASSGLGASMSGGSGGGVAPSNLSIAEQLMQLDQAITLTMQDIDANLSAAHQTVTSKILPAVKRYGVASARTWQGAKFWMKFFEAAADVSLSGASGMRAEDDDDHATLDQTESELLHDADDVTQSQYADEAYGEDGDEDEDTIGMMQDPLDRMDVIADLRSTPLNARPKDFGLRLGQINIGRRPSASPRKGGDGGRARATEEDLTRVTEDEDDEGDSLPPLIGMSPPQTLRFSVPQSRYMNTPAREAARLMVDDVLRTIDGIADPVAMAARTRQERAGDSAALGGAGGRAPPASSVVGTPLRPDKGKAKLLKNRGRDSLPTPPTVTKLPPRPLGSYHLEPRAPATVREEEAASTTPLAAPSTARPTGSVGSASGSLAPGSIGARSNAGRVMDEGEDGGAADFDLSELQGTKVTPGSGLGSAGGKDRMNSLMNLDDEDSDSQSESDDDDDALRGANVIPAYPATASKSGWSIGSGQASSGGSRTTGSRQGRSIEDDTLFGVRTLATSSNARPNAGPMQNPFAKPLGGGAAGPSYKPVDSTVHGGRSLIAADRSDTYSAPSPTPFGK